jgi:hypothetical protein
MVDENVKVKVNVKDGGSVQPISAVARETSLVFEPCARGRASPVDEHGRADARVVLAFVPT